MADTVRAAGTRGHTTTWQRAQPWVAAGGFLAVLGLSLLRRLAMLPRLSYDYDEGVYWQSLESLRHGHRLFAEVFSSQPPLFLAGLSPIYNILRGGIVAGRLTVMVGSLVGLCAVFLIGRALAGTWTGLLAMAMVAFDPLYLSLSDVLQADLPSVSVGLVGVAVAALAWRCGTGPWPWAVAGAVVGLSIMTKLLGVVFVVPVAWLAFSTDESRWRHLGSAAGGLLAAVAVVLAPFAGELSAVYRGAIGLHLGARVSEPQSLGEKLDRIRFSYPAVVPALAALVGCGAAILGRIGWVGMPVAWLAAALAADLAQGPLFIHHLVVLAPPLCLLAGAAPGLVLKAVSRLRPEGSGSLAPAVAVASAGAVLAGALGLMTMTSPLPPTDASAEPAIKAITDRVAPGVPVVTDQLFAAAWTGHPVPPSLVDVSHARIRSGDLTTAQIEAATRAGGARAVIFSTGRLVASTGFHEWVGRHFHLVRDAGGGLQVWVRNDN